MKTMDSLTSSYYEQNAKELVEQYSAVQNDSFVSYLHQAFFEKKSILDLGAGSGRDMKTLLGMCYDVYGLDASLSMVEAAKERYPELGGKLFHGDLFSPLPDSFPVRRFDGLLLSGVIQHISRENLFQMGFQLKSLLNNGGSLLLSMPAERPDVKDERDPNQRLFILYPPSEVILLLERIGFKIKSMHHTRDSLGRKDFGWTVLIFDFEGHESRSIDRIESILNRDSKTASYKLALIRSFCDIARENYKSVAYRDDYAIIPSRLAAEKWALYYYTVRDIPQASSEKLRFSSELEEISAQLEKSGGAWELKRRMLEDDKSVSPLLKSIAKTIKLGPVEYSGSSFGEKIFKWEKDKIVIPFDVWYEIVTMGHWISDSILLKWAEFSAGLARSKNIKLDKYEILSRLMESYEADRDTSVVRKIIDQEQNPECVWTGVSLKKEYAIDHVIPYSLWKNNDLWNLLPSLPKVNLSKSDKLPTRELVIKQKDAIVSVGCRAPNGRAPTGGGRATPSNPRRYAPICARTGSRGNCLLSETRRAERRSRQIGRAASAAQEGPREKQPFVGGAGTYEGRQGEGNPSHLVDFCLPVQQFQPHF